MDIIQTPKNMDSFKLSNPLNQKIHPFYLLNPFYPLNPDCNKLPSNPLIVSKLNQNPFPGSQNFTSFPTILENYQSELSTSQKTDLVNLEVPSLNLTVNHHNLY